MCDQTEVIYKEGDVVWVKLGSYFWPGEVQDIDKLDEEILVSFKKKPIAAVKFFDEDKYEYVKNLNQICFYNCRKKQEYIKKGLDMYRRQKDGSYMDKFPDDVRKAEIRTGGNPNILSDPEFQPQEKPNYHALFGGDKKGKQGSPKQTSLASTNGRKSQSVTPLRDPPRLITITHPRFVRGEIEHKVHIRQQPSSSSASSKSPASVSGTAAYKCQHCDFTSNRLNVIVLHNKFHSSNAQTNNNNAKSKASTSKSKSPAIRVRTVSSTSVDSRIKPKPPPFKSPEPPSRPLSASPAQTLSQPKSPAVKRKVKDEDVNDTVGIGDGNLIQANADKKRPKVAFAESPEKKKSKAQSSDSVEKKTRTTERSHNTPMPPVLGKRKGSRGEDKASKKVKNDEEIREKLLADWDDEEDAEQEEKEIELLKQKLKGDTSASSDSTDVLASTVKNDDKTVSCFDFDDSKDAILDNELEERAKKFVENRKVPKVADEKLDKANNKQLPGSPSSVESTTLNVEAANESAPGTEDFSKAISTLLAETEVPKLPEIPLAVASSEVCKSSNILPDVVLDSNIAVNNENKVEVVEETPNADFQGGDHDYSAKQKVESMSENQPVADDDILDINSMPVVMADAVITVEPSTSQVTVPVVNIQMPKIDLVPNPNATNTHTIVMDDGRLAMAPSVQSVVKAVRNSSVDRSKTSEKTSIVSVTQVSGSSSKVTTRPLSSVSKVQNAEKLTPARGARLLQQGIASGKYVIVQPTGTAQSRLTPKSNSGSQPLANIKPVAGTSQQQLAMSPTSSKLVIITKPQSGGQQQVLTALTPSQQKTLAAGCKLPPQRLLTSTGQLLTPVNPRNVMAKGTKLTPVQQMRTLTAGKQTLGPKLQMQSLQTKIILPTMETVKVPQTQPQPLVRMVTSGKTQSNTILIQATQGGSMLSSIVSKVNAASSSQLSPKPTVLPKQQRPRLLTSATMLQQAAGKPATVVPSSPKVQQTKQAFQPRMLIQKSRSAVLNSKTDLQTSKAAPSSQATLVSQAQVPKQHATKSGVQTVQKVIQTKQSAVGIKPKAPTLQQPIQKTAILSSSSILGAKSLESVPSLVPMQLSSTSNELISLAQGPGMSLPSFHSNISEQITTSGNALGDNAAPTYMLLTIDEAGNLQPYTNQQLISYDTSDQAGQTIYIDGLESSGDLDNIILTIGNSSSLALDMGQTSTMTNVSSIYNTRAPSSSQDILAAALANTDVFQSEVSLQDTLTVVSSNRSSVMTPCVVESSVMLTSPPPSLLLPSLNRAADVSETSLTLNQPIMTPLEVPSSVVPTRVPAPISFATRAPAPISFVTRAPAPISFATRAPAPISFATRAPAPISFPMELPLTASQTLAVPMTSYTVVSENVPNSGSVFQPSMPLLSEEIPNNRTAVQAGLSHSQVTYDGSQEHSDLASYSNTIQIVQEDNLPETKLMYQSQLVTQASNDNVHCTDESESPTATSLSQEPPHSPTPTMLSAAPLVIAETTLAEELPVGISKLTHFQDASKPLDISMGEHKTSVSLSSVLSSVASDSSHSILLPKGSETEHAEVLQNSQSCNSELTEFLHPQTTCGNTQHSFTSTVETAGSLDPSTGLMEMGSNLDNMKISDSMRGDTSSMSDCHIILSNQNQVENVYVSVANQVQDIIRSNVLNNMLDMPPNSSKVTDNLGGDENSEPQSMPLLAEEDPSASLEQQSCETKSLEDSKCDSQSSMDSSSEIRYDESGR